MVQIIPSLRKVEGYYGQVETNVVVDSEVSSQSSAEAEKKSAEVEDVEVEFNEEHFVQPHDSITVHNPDGKPVTLMTNRSYELRNESGRKWYKKWYDEFEYRMNKKDRVSRFTSFNIMKFLYPSKVTNSKAEKTLLFKIDILIGLYFLMLCWSKSVDLNNYTSAYISGMKEDLKFVKNDYVYTSSITGVGAIIFQIPFMYILPRYPAHFVLPIMDLGWTWFTFACYRANSLAEFRGYRFIANSFGGAYYPVSQYILGSWYGPDELSSRVFLFFCGQLLGGVTSGLLQGRIFKSLNMVHGLAGWRWMFLIDAIAISLPTCFLGFFLIPGTPDRCYSLFLTDEEIKIARARVKRFAIKNPTKKLPAFFSWSNWKRLFLSPTFYILCVFDTVSWNNMTAFSGSYSLWLKSLNKYSVVTINNLSTLPAALGFVYVALCSFGSDFFRCKWIFIFFSNIMNAISCAILIKWDVSSSAKWFAFLTTYFSVAASPCLWSIINDFLRFDPQLKAMTWIAIYSFSQSTYSWIPLLTWKTVDSPKFRTGYIASLVFTLIYAFWSFVVLFFYKKNEKNHAVDNGIILYNSDPEAHHPVPEYVEKYMEQREDGYYYLKENQDRPSIASKEESN